MELSHPADALSTLMGARVVDAAGARLGRVRDVQARWAGETIVVEALLVGRRRAVPWADVVTVADGVVTIRASRRG